MVKLKSLRANMLRGHSLIEVIISTIIILITFMMFSFLSGQLMTSRRMVPETLLLLKLGTLTEKEVVDTQSIKKCYKNMDIDISLHAIPTNYLKITDKSTQKMIFQYYFANNSGQQGSLYSK